MSNRRTQYAVNLPQSGPQVLRADLNCSEAR
jgi:hypothetical protein